MRTRRLASWSGRSAAELLQRQIGGVAGEEQARRLGVAALALELCSQQRPGVRIGNSSHPERTG